MNVVVTGAAGFIGSVLLRALAARPEIGRVTALDQSAPAERVPDGVRFERTDIAQEGVVCALIAPDTDVVFHLAALVSGGAERDFALGLRTNLDATRELLEACRLAGRCPKLVFASSIGVYGGELPDPITDETPPAPRLSYGAQKLACEILINDYTRRGFLDGRTLRLPAVLVRPGAPNSALSGWTSAIIREPLAGRDYVCPVRADTRQPCLSVERAAQALLHAAGLAPQALGQDRTVLLSSVSASAQQMWDAVRRAGARGRVAFRPDPQTQAVMDSVPRATRSARAARLGFRHDEDIDEIVAAYAAALAAA